MDPAYTIVPKYPTLPPGLFSNQLTPIQQNTPARTEVAATEGVPQLLIPSIETPMLNDVLPESVAAKPPSNETPPPSPVSIAQALPLPRIVIRTPINRDLSLSKGARFGSKTELNSPNSKSDGHRENAI